MKASPTPLLEVALNGSRTAEEHPAIPRTPDELARATHACWQAGARAAHLHPYDDEGAETFDADACARAIRAVRALSPEMPISLSTSSDIEADPERRLAMISRWHLLPELVTANQGEPGIRELCEHLIERGVGVEAGLLSVADAEAFVESGLADRCVRALVEPLDEDPQDAVAHGAAIERVLEEAGIELEQVHHGDGVASWAVSERGVARGHGFRTGLEDTVFRPDGTLARDNAELVRLAAEIITRVARARE
jgi:uncharacterized protein (DUF849 family)